MVSGVTYKSYLKADSFTIKPSFAIDKFRLVHQDGIAYLEGYYNQTGGDDVEIYIICLGENCYMPDFLLGKDYIDNWTYLTRYRDILVADNTVHTGQTLIGTEITCTNLVS